jgi:hypothetical protein
MEAAIYKILRIILLIKECMAHSNFQFFKKKLLYPSVLDLVSQICDVILMNAYLDLGNHGGSGFWDGGYMNKGREMGRSVYEQPGNEVDGSCHSKEGSK